ncbi:MAG: DUF1501 domain-containing protein [Planctomycetaceae bacterium]|nr:DUF1501 domain-containing protein [Planctomycetaceae bacterium]
MLTLWGDRQGRLCDGTSRRSFLRTGALGLGGLSLADLLRLKAQADTSASTSGTSVIFIELAGGPSQFETYDPKPRAPVEYRGPMSAIATSLPGEQFCETLPRQAVMLDKLTVIRSIRHSKSSHDPSSHLTQTGYYKTGQKGGPSQMPCFGSVIGKTRGPNAPSMPPYVAVPTIMRNGGAAHLGRGYEPFQTAGDPNDPKFQVKNLSLSESVTFDRLDDRRSLQTALDRQRQLVDLDGSAVALDEFKRQAFDLVTSPQARNAFDISQESDQCRDRYGRSTVGQSMLLARRLVESGVTCVTVRVTGWDDHTSLVKRLRPRAAQYDQGLAALVEDLHERSMQDDVLIIAMGEFGRTPRFNKNKGRDHWGSLMSVLLSGGGLKPGIFGASNSKGEVPVEMEYRPENVLAMLYRHLGIDPSMSFPDFSGRPRYLLEERELIHEII